MNIRQSEVAPIKPECELFMIQTKHVEEGGVPIVHVHFACDGMVSEFIGFTE